MRGLRELDRILRGDATAAAQLQRDGFAVPLAPLVCANFLLAAFYGVCMGVFGICGRDEPEFRLMIADAVKVPLLFILTAFVTFPSLYVFNALVGSSLRPNDLAKLLTASLGVMLAVLAGFGPIVAFFSITTTSYPFIVLLNVAVFTVAGVFGIAFLLRTIEKITLVPVAPRTVFMRAPVSPPEEAGGPPNPAPRIETVDVIEPPVADPRVRIVFRAWLVAFCLVGAQMSWVLRPLIGTPDHEFTWLRHRDSSFFGGVLKSLRLLFN